MAAISNRSPEVKVEWTNAAGQLVSKQFKDAYTARRFYVSLCKQGLSPTVKKV